MKEKSVKYIINAEYNNNNNNNSFFIMEPMTLCI